jgi:hypothetical protein
MDKKWVASGEHIIYLSSRHKAMPYFQPLKQQRVGQDQLLAAGALSRASLAGPVAMICSLASSLCLEVLALKPVMGCLAERLTVCSCASFG